MPRSLSEEVQDLMREYEQPLCRYAAGIVHDGETARDVVQEAFIRWVRQRQGDAAPVANPKAWLYRVVHNLAVDFRRRHDRLEPLAETPESDPAPGPDEVAQRREATALAWQALGTLSDRERRIVLLKVMDERSYREIAEIMELTVTNVGFILHTALKKLARDLQRQSH